MVEYLHKSVKKLNGKVLEGWTQSSTENGVTYYINHDHVVTQWDHPDYIKLIDEILHFNNIKYAAYRTACKFRIFQKRLKFDRVTLLCVTSAFDTAGLHSSENTNIISVPELESILYYVMRESHKNTLMDYDTIMEIIINFILNAFDENRTGKLEVLQCKVILAILCGGKLQEKYHYICSQISDQDNYCSIKKLAQLLHIISAVPEMLSEKSSFGISYVPAAVASCFKGVGLSGDIGVTEDYILNWLFQEPQTLVWWTTAYRLEISEFVCHDVKCSVCKQYPCIGLRYQCLHCLSYNFCQDCFLSGRISKSHKTTHPIQEYCYELSAKQWRKSFIKLFQHRIKMSKQLKPRYLSFTQYPVGLHLSSLLHEARTHNSGMQSLPLDFSQGIKLKTVFKSVDLSKSEEYNGNSSKDLLDTPLSINQLIHSVIMQLRKGQRLLSERLQNCAADQGNLSIVLQEHVQELQTQIYKLQQVLKEENPNSFQYSKRNIKHRKSELPRMESTPIVGDRVLHLSLSPIGPESPNDSAVLDNKENHNVEKKSFFNVISSTRQSIAECETMSDQRVVSTNNENLMYNSRQVLSVKEKEIGRFPSFSELSLNDLTSTSSFVSSGVPISNNNIYKEFQDELRRMKGAFYPSTTVENLNQDLDAKLQVFERVFPIFLQDLKKTNLPDKITAAACEVGDSIVTYIEALPIAQEWTAF